MTFLPRDRPRRGGTSPTRSLPVPRARSVVLSYLYPRLLRVLFDVRECDETTPTPSRVVGPRPGGPSTSHEPGIYRN